MDISFVLVDPVVPENVGFCARGLTTMGFSDLRIVGAPKHQTRGARNTAYASHELLESVKTYSSLEEAVSDRDLVVGTTARSRVKRYDRLSPAQLQTVLAEKPIDCQVALVFGSESDGLKSEDIARCDVLTTIPLKTEYPSLNLAQAVLVYAYELSKEPAILPTDSVVPGLTKTLKNNANELLDALDFEEHPIHKQRIMDRLMLLGQKDTELLMGVLSRLKRKMK